MLVIIRRKIRKIRLSRMFLIALSVCDLLGLRYIYRLIIPNKNSIGVKKPSTFVLWVVGIYTALFSIASQQYENRIDTIENRVSLIIAQISMNPSRANMNLVSPTQNMLCPLEPKYFKPITTLKSILFEHQTLYVETVNVLRTLLVNHKGFLSNLDLTGCVLEDSNLSSANFYSSILKGAKLSGADLEAANLGGAIIENADMTNTYLVGANLANATIRDTNLQKAKLDFCKLMNASIINTNLQNSEGLTVKILLETKTLYKTIIDPDTMKVLEILNPTLFKKPKDEE